MTVCLKLKGLLVVADIEPPNLNIFGATLLLIGIDAANMETGVDELFWGDFIPPRSKLPIGVLILLVYIPLVFELSVHELAYVNFTVDAAVLPLTVSLEDFVALLFEKLGDFGVNGSDQETFWKS